ncbi:hypothetical protein EB796_014701 [Bugula neritina]|uniref:Uncharacterized protein n=1 Tax=Bugula neritina TaxID=10212 RepID=A0A7J7JL48_BUGNE|nr:hypothetical protein EB796_014701 [Bugula neritina]
MNESMERPTHKTVVETTGKNLKSKTDTEYIEATDENTAKVDRGFVKNGDESMDTLANGKVKEFVCI